VPVTVVWGASDRIVPMPEGVELTRVEAGHMPHMEAPGEVLTAVRTHL
jgi:pyruvate dehydrogenase E2 component (dihydrolipoamide acetyltransferase)